MYESPKASYPNAAGRIERAEPEQSNHQQRLHAAYSSVRRVTDAAQDLLDAMVGNATDIRSAKTETVPPPSPFMSVLERTPGEIQELCDKTMQALHEIRQQLRL